MTTLELSAAGFAGIKPALCGCGRFDGISSLLDTVDSKLFVNFPNQSFTLPSNGSTSQPFRCLTKK